MTRRSPRVLVFDSGLGGLTVEREVARLRPDAEIAYVADDEGFPYGAWGEAELVDHVAALMERLLRQWQPDAAVIACNTASTLVLPALRARFPDLPFVGTVPAIKPAAALSQSKVIAVLATPGTVARDYTRDLIAKFAGDCHVELVGSRRLASMAEADAGGATIEDAAVAAEIAPCFVHTARGQTDCVVLACTHYPLLLARFTILAPWPTRWIDPAHAIARRLDTVLTEAGFPARTADTPKLGQFAYTSGQRATTPVEAMLAAGNLRQLPSPEPRPVAPSAPHSIISSG